MQNAEEAVGFSSSRSSSQKIFGHGHIKSPNCSLLIDIRPPGLALVYINTVDEPTEACSRTESGMEREIDGIRRGMYREERRHREKLSMRAFRLARPSESHPERELAQSQGRARPTACYRTPTICSMSTRVCLVRSPMSMPARKALRLARGTLERYDRELCSFPIPPPPCWPRPHTSIPMYMSCRVFGVCWE